MILVVCYDCINKKVLEKATVKYYTHDGCTKKAIMRPKVFKRYKRIDTDYLTSVDSQLFEIAYKKFVEMTDWTSLCCLFDLFEDCDGIVSELKDEGNAKHTLINVRFLPRYHEDEDGNRLSESEFQKISIGHGAKTNLNPVMPNDLLYQLMETGIRNTTLKKEEINLTDGEIESLQLFCKTVEELINTGVCNAKIEITQHMNTPDVFDCNRGISESQWKAAVLCFRKLVADKERIDFNSITNIVCRPKKIQNDIRLQIIKRKKIFNDIYNAKLTHNDFFNKCLTAGEVGPYVPKVKDFIKEIFYSGLIHEWKQPNTELRENIEASIRSQELREFIFIGLLRELTTVFHFVATDISYILETLDKNEPVNTLREKTKQELEFSRFLLEKKYQIASCLCDVRKLPASEAHKLLAEAQCLIIERIKLTEWDFQ